MIATVPGVAAGLLSLALCYALYKSPPTQKTRNHALLFACISLAALSARLLFPH